MTKQEPLLLYATSTKAKVAKVRPEEWERSGIKFADHSKPPLRLHIVDEADLRAEAQWAKEEQEDLCPALTEYRRKCREYGGRDV